MWESVNAAAWKTVQSRADVPLRCSSRSLAWHQAWRRAPRWDAADVAEDAQAVATDRQSWMRHAVDALLVGIGTAVVLGATVPIFAGGGWAGLLAKLVVLVACGFASTALVRLPLRWSCAVAVVLWVLGVGSLVVTWRQQDGPAGLLRLAVLESLYAGLFVVGAASRGWWAKRRRRHPAVAAAAVVVAATALILPGLARHTTQPVAPSPSSGPSLSEPSAKWLATGNTTRTWPGSTGSVHYGIDLVNDTATTMVVDSVTVVTDQGQALSGAAASQLTATVTAIDLTSTTSPEFTGSGWRPPPLPAQGLPIHRNGGKAALVVTVHPQCPGQAIPATAKIVVGYHNTTQSFTLTANELTGATHPLTALVRQACS